MQANSSSADRIREKKKLFLAREQRIIDAAIELFLEECIDRITVSKIALRAAFGSFMGFLASTFMKFFVALIYLGVFVYLCFKYQSILF